MTRDQAIVKAANLARICKRPMGVRKDIFGGFFVDSDRFPKGERVSPGYPLTAAQTAIANKGA